MKAQELLFGPFVERLPNFRYVDTTGKPTTLVDFTMPTDGLEAPWGMAQFVFLYDTRGGRRRRRARSRRCSTGPRPIPGRFTYPAPPDFVGSTFLKQVLIELTADPGGAPAAGRGGRLRRGHRAALALARGDPARTSGARARPSRRRGPALHQLLDDGEVDLSMAFNPAEASAAITAGRLPESVRSFILEAGTIGNTHFVAIPFNAAHKAGAMVVADFLMSPEAQAHKQDPRVWGDGTVLDLDALAAADRARFEALPRGIATLPPEAAGAGAARSRIRPGWSRSRRSGCAASAADPPCCAICRRSPCWCSSDRSPPGCSARCCRPSATCRRSAASSSRSSPGGGWRRRPGSRPRSG